MTDLFGLEFEGLEDAGLEIHRPKIRDRKRFVVSTFIAVQTVESGVVFEQLENVAIANALQLEAARRRAVHIPFIFVSRAKFELAQPIRCRFRAYLLFIRYVTL